MRSSERLQRLTGSARLSAAAGVLLALMTASAAVAELVPPEAPPENPISEEKRILGKILFWDEQLSSDDTMACGTCHRFAAASSDPRIGVNPGFDGLFDTADDVFGSMGVRRADASGTPLPHPIFGFEPQVTRRATPPIMAQQYAGLLFYDGRAAGTFLDPETGAVAVVSGGALESQSVTPILSSVEMAYEGRTWSDVRNKLESVAPLALSSELPGDVAAAVAAFPTYGDLFAHAFGDPAISARRIAFAIATYERTLVPDDTPWDRFEAGDSDALTPSQVEGLAVFTGKTCRICHVPPVFSDRSFRNIGLRPIHEDAGRFEVTGQSPDRGRFKVPTLRNAGLRPRLMHTGRLETMADVVDFYFQLNGQVHFPENQDPFVSGLAIDPADVAPLVDFLANGLTDPRAAAEVFPFDRPRLGSEVTASVTHPSVSDARPRLVVSARPNPLAASTTIRFDLPEPVAVRIRLFDGAGRHVRTLVDGGLPAGPHAWTWDGRAAGGESVPAGVYFYRLETPRGAASGKLTRVQ